jgi:hypothetical protein
LPAQAPIFHRTEPEHDMATTVDELTVSYTEDGKEEYGPDKYTIRRYQKRNGEYQQKSKFNISSKDQAEKVIEALQDWIK